MYTARGGKLVMFPLDPAVSPPFHPHCIWVVGATLLTKPHVSFILNRETHVCGAVAYFETPR